MGSHLSAHFPDRRTQFFFAIGFAVFLATASGCQRQASPGGQSEMPTVPVSHPLEREVTDFVDFTGRTDAVQSVNIIPRVTGYLEKMPFREGSEVKAGDLLFVVDPRPYQFQYDQAESQVVLARAQLDLADSTLKRYQDLKKETPGAVSDQAIDQYMASVAEAKARVNANQKSLEVFQLNKEFTRVVSPIDGQVSRYYLTLGNLVNQDQTLLTTVVSLEPMYAYFDMDERNLLQIRRAINDGKIKMRGDDGDADGAHLLEQALAAQGVPALGVQAPAFPQAFVSLGVAVLGATALRGNIPVLMGLQGEDGFPHKGEINFSNNQVNPGTGSISVRGVFQNPKPTNGIRLLSPGMFVRIRMPIGQPRKALLVIDKAIQSDQGRKYLYVIDADKKAQSRRITTGALQEDGLRVIATGLEKGDWVVVGGFPQIRPNMEVKTEEQKRMPSFGEGDDAAVGGSGKPAEPKK